MPANDKEVFDYFGKDPATRREIDFLAYASFAFDKFAWMDRFQELHDRSPTAEEIDAWINQLPESRLDEIQEWAVRFFDDAATAYADEKIRQATEQAVRESILNEVRAHTTNVLNTVQSATSFKNTWWQQLLVGLFASFLVALLIIVASAIFARDPSPLALYKGIIGEQNSPPSVKPPAQK